jgi:7,8-dihydropterin-6-yl-methyl-4-(beta-D-ribofuranosyl)aminobenzene 5'-phosphate synthase
MKVTLTLLCENSIGKATAALAEHGFSCLIETSEGKYLFDTGQGQTLNHNLRILDKDLADLKAVFLSHGHYDHAGGLPDVLRQTGPLDVYAHPGIFQDRYWVGKSGQRFVGIPVREPFLSGLGARFRWIPEFSEVAPGLFFTGKVPRITGFEKGDASLMIPLEEKSGFVPDPFEDDCSLVIQSESGPILLLGCAHSGVVNILQHVRDKVGIDSLFAIVGGTHLAPADDEQFARTVDVFKEFQVRKIVVGHCTGQKRAADLYRLFGKKFSFAAVGSTLEA